MDVVSVIIPTYGGGADPCKAVDSVLSQDYPYVEVIVVDDNGEGTKQQKINAEKFDKYSSDERFRYIVHKENKGGSTARNTGAYASKGEYLSFLDDDDEFMQGKIRLQLESMYHLDETWAGTYSSYHIYNKTGEFVRTIKAVQSKQLLIQYLSGSVRIGTNAPVIRRAAFFHINGFDESFKRHQDWEFIARLLDQYKLFAVPQAFFNRNYREASNRFDINQRIAFLDKYCEKMTQSIGSIPKTELDRILKDKYVSLWLGLLRRKDFDGAKELFRSKKFGIREVVIACKESINYASNRWKFGQQF